MVRSELYWNALLYLLAGRSQNPLPWTRSEELHASRQERILWLALDGQDRKQAMARIRELWRAPNTLRILPAHPEWGEWAAAPIRIEDYAFGCPVMGFRPYALPEDLPPHPLVDWLVSAGFFPIEGSQADGGTLQLILRTPPTRLVAESKRLLALICKRWSRGGEFHLEGHFDPASDQAWQTLEYTDPRL